MRTTRLAIILLLLGSVVASAQENFKRTDSERPYVHRIELRDASGTKVDPFAADPEPFSTRTTCGQCHDTRTIAQGHHFRPPGDAESWSGRRGEPWVLVDPRTATVLPLSKHGWRGSFAPERVGLDTTAFFREFGRHSPGGSDTYFDPSLRSARMNRSGDLDIDCLACHAGDRTYDQGAFAKETRSENFAHASAVAWGLAAVEGDIASIGDDAGPEAAMPRLRYDARRFDAKGEVFLDIVRRPADESCAGCHDDVSARGGLHDGDVHTRAGMDCVTCHAEDISHRTPRGDEGTIGAGGANMSCRNCHLGGVEAGGGRFGAPKPEHRGLPPLHLESLTCTACHSGPRVAMSTIVDRTPRAHGLGLASQSRRVDDLPAIQFSVFARDESGRIAPHRRLYPSFFGVTEKDGSVMPLPPKTLTPHVRKAARVRQDLLRESENQDALRQKIAATLRLLQETDGGRDVAFFTDGRRYRLDAEGKELVSTIDDVAAPYDWPIGHDVRPARDSLGASGCNECHLASSPFQSGEIVRNGVLLETRPNEKQARSMTLDRLLTEAWADSFERRDLFKWILGASVALLSLLVLATLVSIVRPLLKRRDTDTSEGGAR